MKKLKLDLQGLNAEVLTRSQLKQILGGDGSSGGGSGGTGCYKCCYPNGGKCSACVWSYSTAPCEYGSVLTSCTGCY